MIAIRIQAYHVIVEAESTESYPDAMTDLTNRAVEAIIFFYLISFCTGINTKKPPQPARGFLR